LVDVTKVKSESVVLAGIVTIDAVDVVVEMIVLIVMPSTLLKYGSTTGYAFMTLIVLSTKIHMPLAVDILLPEVVGVVSPLLVFVEEVANVAVELE
jgi:hypothetical protein